MKNCHKSAKYRFLVLITLLLSITSYSNTLQSDSISYTRFTEKQYCFNTSDGVIKYIDEGVGEPIVLLHGVPTSGWLYRKMITDLTTKGFRVIVPDMLGFGNSDSPLGIDVYSPKNHAKRLLELMNNLKINSWIQVVHDAGSIWTSELIKQDPSRIKKIVLLNSVLTPKGVSWDKQIGTGISAKIGLTLQRWGIKKSSFVSQFIKKNTDPKTFELTSSKLALSGYEDPIKQGKIQAVFAHHTYMVETFSRDNTILDGFTGEMAVVWGENDHVLLWQPQAKIIIDKFNIKANNIHLISAGHLITEQNSIIINGIISDFIHPK